MEITCNEIIEIKLILTIEMMHIIGSGHQLVKIILMQVQLVVKVRYHRMIIDSEVLSGLLLPYGLYWSVSDDFLLSRLASHHSNYCNLLEYQITYGWKIMTGVKLYGRYMMPYASR